MLFSLTYSAAQYISRYDSSRSAASYKIIGPIRVANLIIRPTLMPVPRTWV